jgi:hypothetical protein
VAASPKGGMALPSTKTVSTYKQEVHPAQEGILTAFNSIIPCGLPQGEEQVYSLLKLDTLQLAAGRFIKYEAICSLHLFTDFDVFVCAG